MEVTNEHLAELLYKSLKGISIITSDNENFIDSISFFFDTEQLIITPIADTDEVKLVLLKESPAISETSTVLSGFIGQTLHYTWTGTNTNGYNDIFMMAFGDLLPDFIIISEGSSLKILNVS